MEDKRRRRRRRARVFFLAAALGAALSAAQEGRGIGAVRIPGESGGDTSLYEASYALVVGASAYRFWPKLPGVRRDVSRVRAVLEEHGFGVVTVEDPDNEALPKAFKDFIDRYGQAEGNRLVFYFAGHGETLTLSFGSTMGYIVPVDAPLPSVDPAGFKSLSLDLAMIEVYSKRIQSKHALFVFDSCFSGSLFAATRSAPPAISYKAAAPVRQYITAGGADETVPDESIFCEQFVAALKGEGDLNADGYVTGQELYSFLEDRVVNYSRGTLHPLYGKIQDPRLDKGDFVFQLRSAAAVAAQGGQTSRAQQGQQSQTPRPPPASLPARPAGENTVLVATIPSGAEIAIDGANRGISPFGLDNLAEGEHLVTASLHGYKKAERRIRVTRFKDLYQETIELEKASAVISASSGLELAAVAPASFVMGDDLAGGEESPAHRVTLGRAFAIGVYETNNRQYAETANWALAKGYARLLRGDLVDAKSGRPLLALASLGPGQFGLRSAGDKLACAAGRESHPVVGVTWYGAVAFCDWLSERDGLPPSYGPDFSLEAGARGYRLPTEAEWEYAARGSEGRKFPSGSRIAKALANYLNSGDPFESLNEPYSDKGGPTTPVGFYDGSLRGAFATESSRSPFGVYDLSGNVAEWCGDWKGAYAAAAATDPAGPSRGSHRVVRGGSWRTPEQYLRASDRTPSLGPGQAASDVGFRVALTP